MHKQLLLVVMFVVPVVAVAFLGGCNIVGPIAAVTAGPPTKAAEYDMRDRTAAIFVDDRRNALGDRGLRRYIGDKVAEELMVHKVLEENVPIRSRDVLAAASADQSGQLVPLQKIGESVGASQLIYIEMMSFRVLLENASPTARAEIRVKVIDIDDQARVYPGLDDAQGHRNMVIDLPTELAFQPLLTRASRREAELTLADMTADKVAKLFYKHELGRPLGSRLGAESR